MSEDSVIIALNALGQPMRLRAFRLLVAAGPNGLVAGQIAERLGVLPNTLSSNLSTLSAAGLIHGARDGRQIRYTADLSALQRMLDWLIRDCCGGHPEICAPLMTTLSSTPQEPAMTAPFNILFLCTGNSARSLIAEAIVNADPSGRFRAFSAGSQPTGQPNPHALQLLERHGYDTAPLRSKSWDEFAGPDAPPMDFVFTVCDNAAGETCPIWPGHPVTAHWGVPDPAAVTGNDAEIAAAFNETHRIFATRLANVMALPLATLERDSLVRELRDIAERHA
ncbi:helix-turn-helix domain-containing protein [Paracoccus sp. (in: a-proteobacteria)]|uniref:arsenate reductase/protein-tyrosine-phosphatase family protein n=1 Tax=Paracoccus sp. TaxID=267 RepID=UPI0026DF6E50|nr:helix-turn-helix domain-containing protein [Paracoccus sp. (in: a-proteobacteria)]MDO5648913.1 helix-turn-helix domain-containing protein [Paracoccus sp. (in: a-proteobacteria)]